VSAPPLGFFGPLESPLSIPLGTPLAAACVNPLTAGVQPSPAPAWKSRKTLLDETVAGALRKNADV